MSVTGPTPRNVASGYIHTAGHETCFFCGAETIDPAVFWMGATGEIFLHPGCAVDLMVRLFRDIHQWQRETGRKFGRL